MNWHKRTNKSTQPWQGLEQNYVLCPLARSRHVNFTPNSLTGANCFLETTRCSDMHETIEDKRMEMCCYIKFMQNIHTSCSVTFPLRMCWKRRVDFFLHTKTINVILIHLGDKIMLLHYTVPRVKLVSSSSFTDNYRISSYFFFYHTFLARNESSSLAARLNFPEPWLAIS
jgi:hypothetical protein